MSDGGNTLRNSGCWLPISDDVSKTRNSRVTNIGMIYLGLESNLFGKLSINIHCGSELMLHLEVSSGIPLEF
jgi:hypothetical protein